MTKNNKRLMLILLMLPVILFPSCGRDTVYVKISASGIPVSRLEEILEKYPLPDGFEQAENKSDTAVFSISLERRFTTLKETEKTAEEEHLTGKIILEEEWYAPAAYFWEFSRNTRNHQYSGSELVPLDSIRLPEKALPMNNLFPGDNEYPGLRVTELKITAEKDVPEGIASALLEWLGKFNFPKQGRNTAEPLITWIGAAGDIMVQRGVEDILLSGNNGLTTIFTDTLAVLRKQDIMLGNLEGSITLRRFRIPKSYNFKFRPRVLPVLYEAGFDYLSLTNNHVYDYGENGFKDTVKYITESPVATSGAGMSIEEAQRYWETDTGREKVRVLSVGAYPRENNGFDGRTQASVTSERPGILFEGPLADKAVKNMVSESTFDIIFIHGGKEWTYRPTEQQRALYRKYIDMGADLVLGSHPHVLQGFEARKGKLIAYSLGNFIFPGMEMMAHAEESVILSVGIYNGSIKYVTAYPVKISGKTIKLDHSPESINRITDLTKELN